jgi:rod shape-determining protein MreD
MKALTYVGLALLTLGLQITVAPNLAIIGIRPNLMLVTLLAVTLRWRDSFVFVYAAALGVTLDSFSHGVLGVYGISFFAVAITARLVGQAMYEDSLLSATLVVFGLSLLEGVIFTSVFQVLDKQVGWGSWIFFRVLPGSVYNAALAPLVFLALGRLERWMKLQSRA